MKMVKPAGRGPLGSVEQSLKKKNLIYVGKNGWRKRMIAKLNPKALKMQNS